MLCESQSQSLPNVLFTFRAQAFSAVPDSQSWANFRKYARRVRRLRYSDRHPAQLETSVLHNFAKYMPLNLDILPNMRSLTWEGDPEFSTLFMHERITHFTFGLGEYIEPVTTVMTTFPEVSRLMPNITHLAIQINVGMAAIEPEVVELLKNLPRLKSVALAQYQFTTKVAECLSKLSDISSIKLLEEDVYAEDVCAEGDVQDIQYFRPSLGKDAFPELTRLAFDSLCANAQRFLTALPTSSRLKTLYINSPQADKVESLRYLISCLADECPSIESLSLTSLVSPKRSATVNETKSISIHTLKPLFRNKHLTSLTLTHQYPLELDNTSVQELSLTWPSLHTLVLNPAPGHRMPPSLTLEALIPFAQNCSKLRHLGLFIKASDQDVLRFGCARFQSLETLDLGRSFIRGNVLDPEFIREILPSKFPRILWNPTQPI